jgi:hypothetical protein
MAIKERKQITGTEAQIKGYAGHNGVLAYATDTKHLHVLSGTAGTTTKLANMSDIPAPVDISGKADKTYVDTELAEKQPKGDYATTSALTSGLAGKADTSHKHTKSQITDFPTIPDTSTLIPKSGNRGAIAGYESSTRGIIVSSTSADSMTSSGAIAVKQGTSGTTWTKVMYMTSGSVGLGANWKWSGGNAPTLKFPGVLVCHWNDTGGIATYTAGVS